MLTSLRQFLAPAPLAEPARTVVAEEFRLIKRPLLHQLHNGDTLNGNLIAVTSAMPGEGKSYCAINLALSMAAERDSTVLLVDAHLAQPALPQFFAMAGRKGITDLLLDDTLGVADVIVKTGIAALNILPAGQSSHLAAELLASRDMGRLLQELASRYADRIIIFDTAPLLGTTEASVLAAQMGQVVLVVDAETTTHAGLGEALRHLESCPHVHLVYNRARVPASKPARRT